MFITYWDEKMFDNKSKEHIFSCLKIILNI